MLRMMLMMIIIITVIFYVPLCNGKNLFKKLRKPRKDLVNGEKSIKKYIKKERKEKKVDLQTMKTKSIP